MLKINASTKSLVERLCNLKVYAISVLSFHGSVCAPDKATLKAEIHALQCTTAGPYNAIPSTLLGVGSVCDSKPVQRYPIYADLVGIHSLSLAARYRVAACSTTLSRGLEKISTARRHNCTPLFALSPIREKNSLPLALRVHLMLFMTHLTKSHKTKSRRLQLACFWTNFINKTLLGLFLVVPRESWDLSVVIVLLTSCTT